MCEKNEIKYGNQTATRMRVNVRYYTNEEMCTCVNVCELVFKYICVCVSVLCVELH